jgi:hypothetical protein
MSISSYLSASYTSFCTMSPLLGLLLRDEYLLDCMPPSFLGDEVWLCSLSRRSTRVKSYAWLAGSKGAASFVKFVLN